MAARRTSKSSPASFCGSIPGKAPLPPSQPFIHQNSFISSKLQPLHIYHNYPILEIFISYQGHSKHLRRLSNLLHNHPPSLHIHIFNLLDRRRTSHAPRLRRALHRLIVRHRLHETPHRHRDSWSGLRYDDAESLPYVLANILGAGGHGGVRDWVFYYTEFGGAAAVFSKEEGVCDGGGC